MNARTGFALTASLAAGIVVGCFSPEFEVASCELTCVTECMPGLTCQDGFCVRPGDEVDCRQQLGRGGGGSGGYAGAQVAGAVGTTPLGSGGAGGSAPMDPPSSGAGGIDGEAGAPSKPEPLEVSAGEVGELCTGEHATVSLGVSGGTAPYRWRLTGSPDGLTLSATEGDEVELAAALEETGTHRVEVVVDDSAGESATASVDIRVHEPPRITTASLPFACLGRPYSVELEASGGEPSERRWSSTVESSTGLALGGNVLAGTPQLAGALRFEVTLEDSRCRSSVELELDVDAGCPVFEPPALDPPCAGRELSYTVGVEGDEYTVRARELPEGVEYDVATGALTGVLHEPANIVFEATSERGRVFEHTYLLAPRKKCWLAYSANGGGVGQVRFYDPLLGSRAALPIAPASPVARFRFSPDGRWLAYAEESHRLTVVRLADFREQAFDVPGLLGLAWSPDSSRLAVERVWQGIAELGGLVMRNDGASDPGTLAEVMPWVTLERVPTEPVLAWVGNDVLVLSAPPHPSVDSRLLYRAEVDGDGFTAPAMLGLGYSGRVVLQAFERGIFAADPLQRLVMFYAPGAIAPVVHGAESIAPNGRYTARVDASDTLLVFGSNSPSGSATLPDATSAGCAALAAWSPEAAHVFCRTPADRMAMHAIEPGASASSPALTLRGQYTYTAAEMDGNRRVVSPSGRFLAFVAGSRLHLAELDPTNPRVFYSEQLPALPGDPESPSDMHADLAFSPDERLLLVHRGAHLWLHSHQDRKPPVWIGNARFTPAAPCFEDAAAAPAAWCGLPGNPLRFGWFAGNDGPRTIAAARDVDGRLMAFVTPEFESVTRMVMSLVDEECDGDCVGQFDFQP